VSDTNPEPTLLADTASAERIGNAALEALDHVRDDFSDDPDAQLELVLVIALVRHRDEDDDEVTTGTYWCEDDRRYVHLGAIRAAQLSAES
jgi:hypothetical protein